MIPTLSLLLLLLLLLSYSLLFGHSFILRFDLLKLLGEYVVKVLAEIILRVYIILLFHFFLADYVYLFFEFFNLVFLFVRDLGKLLYFLIKLLPEKEELSVHRDHEAAGGARVAWTKDLEVLILHLVD